MTTWIETGAVDLPETQTAEVEVTGRRGVYRLINVGRGRWLVYGKGALQYVAMLVRRGAAFELRPMLPRGPEARGADLGELAAAL
jgi:hypothetical protein